MLKIRMATTTSASDGSAWPLGPHGGSDRSDGSVVLLEDVTPLPIASLLIAPLTGMAPLFLPLQPVPSLEITAPPSFSHTIGFSTGGRLLSDANAAANAGGADEASCGRVGNEEVEIVAADEDDDDDNGDDDGISEGCGSSEGASDGGSGGDDVDAAEFEGGGSGGEGNGDGGCAGDDDGGDNDGGDCGVGEDDGGVW